MPENKRKVAYFYDGKLEANPLDPPAPLASASPATASLTPASTTSLQPTTPASTTGQTTP